MAETMCEVNSAPPPNYNMDPHCLSSPEEEYKDGHMTMKSDDSGILMDDTHEFSMNDTSDQTTTESDNSSDTTPEADNRDTIENAFCEEEYEEEDDEETETETVQTEEEYYQETETDDMEPVEENILTKTTITRVVKTVHTTHTSDETPQEHEEITESTVTQETHTQPQSADDTAAAEPTDTQTTYVAQETDSTWRETESPEGVLEEFIEPQRKEDQEQSSSIPAISIDAPSSSSLHSEDGEDEHGEEVKQEEPQPEEPEEEEEEIERVDFQPGMKCDDVWTALDILKTRYRLSNASMRKCIITWSSWDVTHISYPLPDRSSWHVKHEEDEHEKEEVDNVRDSICVKEDEIAKLVEQVLENERKKKKVPTATLR